MAFILETTWLTGIDFWIKVIFCRRSCQVFKCSRPVRCPGVDDSHLKTALFASNWLQSEVGGVQVLVHCSYLYDD